MVFPTPRGTVEIEDARRALQDCSLKETGRSNTSRTMLNSIMETSTKSGARAGTKHCSLVNQYVGLFSTID